MESLMQITTERLASLLYTPADHPVRPAYAEAACKYNDGVTSCLKHLRRIAEEMDGDEALQVVRRVQALLEMTESIGDELDNLVCLGEHYYEQEYAKKAATWEIQAEMQANQ